MHPRFAREFLLSYCGDLVQIVQFSIQQKNGAKKTWRQNSAKKKLKKIVSNMYLILSLIRSIYLLYFSAIKSLTVMQHEQMVRLRNENSAKKHFFRQCTY